MSALINHDKDWDRYMSLRHNTPQTYRHARSIKIQNGVFYGLVGSVCIIFGIGYLLTVWALIGIYTYNEIKKINEVEAEQKRLEEKYEKNGKKRLEYTT